MARRRGDGEEKDRAALNAAMKGVKPLEERDKLRPQPPPAPARRAGTPDRESVRFAVRHLGERIEGLAPGIDREHLRRLRSGKVRVDVRLDLHGLDVAEARRAVQEALLSAFAAGRRCVLLVHGRGLGSDEGPVLKAALPGWLEEPSIGALVMAFASAVPGAGGSGATYVLLRRKR